MISCSSCKEKFDTAYKLGEHHAQTSCVPLHIKAALHQPPSICIFCDQPFDTDYHLGQHHGSYTCLLDPAAPSAGTSSTALTVPEPVNSEWKCGLCKVECPSEYFLRKHKATCDPKPRGRPPKGRKFPCVNCGDVFDSEAQWRKHMKIYVSRDRVYFCSKNSCSFSSHILNDIRTHLKRTHHSKVHKTDQITFCE